MKNGSVLFLLFLVSSNTACAANNDWIDEWKINDKNRYMSFTIKNTDNNVLEFFYDEGIGINGIRINGIVKLAGNNTAFVDSFIRGNKCKLKLQLSKNKLLTLSGCELDSYDEGFESEKVFVPKTQKLYYKAGFNCAKASTKTEFAICDSKILAASDKKLGTIYKKLRKNLSSKNKRRLRNEQRQWIKERNFKCEQKSKNNLNYCLRRSYGVRLLALNILNDYKIWQTGKLDYSVFLAVYNAKKQQKPSLNFHPLNNGLGLWLGGVMKRRLTDTGNFEVQNGEFVNNSYILSGPYISNPGEGHDPRAFGNNIFIEFSSTNGVWVGLVSNYNNFIYIPKNKTISDASGRFKFWKKDFEEAEIVNVF